MSGPSFAEHAPAVVEALGLRREGREWHGPCPACGGSDRFWIADHRGRLSINCRQCPGAEPFRALLDLGLLPRRGAVPRPLRRPPPRPTPPETEDRQAAALALWRRTMPLGGTPAEAYLRDVRGVDPADVADLRCLPRARYDAEHPACPVLVAAMRDPATAELCGVHRTFLTPDGRKVGRKMLGAAGVVMLDPDDAVTDGLAIAEGIEDGLAVRRVHRPVWAALSCGGIERFPVLGGIEVLAIYADADDAGRAAAERCAERWAAAGREVVIRTPVNAGDPAEVLHG